MTGHSSVPAAPLLTPDPTPVLTAGLPPGQSGHSQTHLTMVDLSTDIGRVTE